MKSSEIRIIENIAILSKDDNGWQKEVNFAIINGSDAVIDVRSWSPDHTECSDGFTMSRSELEALIDKAGSWHESEDCDFSNIKVNEEEPDCNEQPSEIWYCVQKTNGACGKGYPVDNGFVVLQGSTISHVIAPSFQRRAAAVERLRDEGIIVNVTFTRNHRFDSCSTAACVVLGRSANGWVEWKNSAGEKLECIRKR